MNWYYLRGNLSYRHFGLDRWTWYDYETRVVAAASSSSTSSVWTGPSPGLGCESGACWQGGGPGGRVGPGARRGRRRRAGAIRGVPDSGPTPENRSTGRIGSSISPVGEVVQWLYRTHLAVRGRGHLTDSERGGLPDARYMAPFRTAAGILGLWLLSMVALVTIGIVAFDDCTWWCTT